MAGLDVAVVGNCRIGALVDARARICWACFPRLDGDPWFCSLLEEDDARGGFCDVVVDGLGRTSQSYVRNTAAVETLLHGTGGVVKVTDLAPRFEQFGRVYRPPMLLRRLEAVEGTPRVTVRMRPRFDYGRLAPKPTLGSNHLRYMSEGGAMRLTTDAPLSYIAQERGFLLDRPVHLFMGMDESLNAPVAETARHFTEETQAWWENWSRWLNVPFEWQDAVIRAAITLKLCNFEETGGILAALTTSIPEHQGSARNWDYRFCWLRDAYFTVHALNRLGDTRTMEDYIRYIENVAALDPDGPLQPLYSVVPGTPLDERVVDTLAGYQGHAPVRVGNGAWNQVQNDGYGSVVLASLQMFFDQRLPRMGNEDLFIRLERVGEKAMRFALTPDAGLWEYRGSSKVRTYSVAMCWAAADRLSRMAATLGLSDRTTAWRSQADGLRAQVMSHGFNTQLNTFVESFGGTTVDASLLLLQELGFISAQDPRFVATLESIEKNLRRGHLLLRYDTPDDFGMPQTAFTTCAFWYVDALCAVGRRAEAREVFEALLAQRNHVGLLSEDVDFSTGALWGNLPQTYCMVGLIVSAMRLSRTWEEGFWRPA